MAHRVLVVDDEAAIRDTFDGPRVRGLRVYTSATALGLAELDAAGPRRPADTRWGWKTPRNMDR